MKKTPTYQLVEAKLGHPPIDDIRAARETDPPTAFHRIAWKLSDQSGVEVSVEAVRRWYNWDRQEREAQPVPA